MALMKTMQDDNDKFIFRTGKTPWMAENRRYPKIGLWSDIILGKFLIRRTPALSDPGIFTLCVLAFYLWSKLLTSWSAKLEKKTEARYE